MTNQKAMIEEAMIASRKCEEKLEVIKVALKQSVIERDCMLMYKAGSKHDLLQIRYVNRDNTIEQLELKFKSKLTVDKAVISTNVFNLLDPYKVLSESEIEGFDLNKYSMNLDGFYVPVSVILSDFLKNRATTKQLQVILDNLDIIESNKRVTKTKLVPKDKSGEVEQVTIDLNLYKKGDSKPVDLTNNNWRKIENELSKNENNKKCIYIINNSLDAYTLELFNKEPEKEIKINNIVGNKKEEENGGENKMSKVNVEKIKETLINKGVGILTRVYENINPFSMEKSIIHLLVTEEKIEELTKLSFMRTFLKMEDDENTIPVQDMTPEQFVEIGEIVRLVGSVVNNMNECSEAEMQKMIKENLGKRLEETLTEEELEVVNMDDVLVAVQNEFAKINNIVVEEEEVKEEKKSKEFRNRFNQIMNGEETVEEDVPELKDVMPIASSRISRSEELVNDVRMYAPVLDRAQRVEKIMDDATAKVFALIDGKELPKEESSIPVYNTRPVRPVEKYVSTRMSIDDLFIENHIVYNSLLRNCVKLEKGNVKVAIRKYERVLNFVKDFTAPITINTLSKRYKAVNNAVNKHTHEELKKDVINEFDYVRSLINALEDTVSGYENMKAILRVIPLDLAINVVYSLCNRTDMNSDSMSFEDKVKFYAIFKNILNINPAELVEEKNVSDLVQQSMRVSIQYDVRGQKVVNL